MAQLTPGPDQALLRARRDALGFIEEQPNLTRDQVTWLMARMAVGSDEEACEEASLPLEVVASWYDDPGFIQVYQIALTNKREAFKLLGTQLLARALMTLNTLYDKALDGNVNAARVALNMHLRSQGLFIDRVSTDDANKVDQLLSMLREQSPVTVLNMEPRP